MENWNQGFTQADTSPSSSGISSTLSLEDVGLDNMRINRNNNRMNEPGHWHQGYYHGGDVTDSSSFNFHNGRDIVHAANKVQ